MSGERTGVEPPAVGRRIHLEILLHEMAVLESRFEPHDTGHLRTAFSVLADRVRELGGDGALPAGSGRGG